MTLLSGECVFVADDDEDDQFLIQQIFKQQSPGCRLRPLRDGVELVEALTECTDLPRLILLDLNMPRMGGLEALELIRADTRYESVAVVILTTSDQLVDRQQAAALKADGYITKPSTMAQYNHIVLQIANKWLLGRCIPGMVKACNRM